jgi:hypothetical protein
MRQDYNLHCLGLGADVLGFRVKWKNLCPTNVLIELYNINI